jgi:hypothetical protein
MDDKKLPANNEDGTVEVVKTSDFTHFDTKAVEEYKNKGMPGLDKLDDVTAVRMMEMYLSGKTYREISHVTNKSKAMVLYLSSKFEWYPKKIEYLRDLEETMVRRTIESRLVGQDFLLQLKQLFEKKIGDKIADYLRTNDVKFANEIDLKEVDKYIKTFEALDKLTGERVKASKSDKSSAPAVGLNLGDGVTIKKVGENEVEVTPKQKKIGDMLKELADFRREEDSKKSLNKSDIKKDN